MMSPSAHTAAAVTAAAALAALFFFRRRARGVPSRTQALPSAVPRVAADAAEIAAAVRAEGVCLVEGVFDAAAVEALRSRIMAIEPKKMQNRRKHRWEHVHSPEAPPLAELGAQPLVAAAIRALLGPKNYLEKAGLLVSHPGAEPQRWHMDTPHLFSVGAHLPPHSLSVFVPLVDLVPANGPTEFQLATHVKANLVAPQRHATACCPAGSLVICARALLGSNQPGTAPSLSSVLLHTARPRAADDVRIMHRGGPNASLAERPVVYLTFSRVWYRDTLNP